MINNTTAARRANGTAAGAPDAAAGGAAPVMNLTTADGVPITKAINDTLAGVGQAITTVRSRHLC